MNRREFLSTTSSVVASGMVVTSFAGRAFALPRDETLALISENGPNNLDIHGVGTNRAGYEAAWNCYDRLVTYGLKTLPDGSRAYDKTVIAPELAERWEIDPTGVTFHLRKDATFHDGTPVTAADVKWSFDRAVTVGGFPTVQMSAGSLLKPTQFSVINDHTFRVEFARPDALTLPDLAVIVPAVFNSALVKKNATEKDPWGLAYTKNNPAGGGAFRVAKWTPGTEVVYERFENWKSGPLPPLKRVIWRTIPSSGNRRALVERGDCDVSFDLPAKDFAEMKREGLVKVASNPIANGMWSLEMNVTKPPFDNIKVRQAIAWATPYQKIMDVVMYGQANPMFGATPGASNDLAWPRATTYTTDMAKAKALLAEAGLEEGFETRLSFDLSQSAIGEPIAVLLQESLGQIGIRAGIDKVPGANWRGQMAKKSMPFMINFFSGWLDYPEYFFFWTYHGQNSVFNTMAYKNPTLDKEVDAARSAAASGDNVAYTAAVKQMIAIAYEEVPRVPLFQPYLNIAMQKSIGGYAYWFHRQLDYRTMSKAGA